MSNCPICNERNGWHYYSGWGGIDDGQLEPEEGWCDFCGFSYQQHSPSPYADMEKAMDDFIFGLYADIENIDDTIKNLLEFKKKIPQLKKRIDFDKLHKELGWIKEEDGWHRKGKLIEEIRHK